MIPISNYDARRIIKALMAYVDTPHDGTLKAINDRRIAKQLIKRLKAKSVK